VRANPERYIAAPPLVLEIANRESFEDFPKAIDIISVARIESSFNPKARNKDSKGIMQVNYGSYNLEKNMLSGISILREYYLKLGSPQAAIIAYNIGIGNYLSKKFLKSGHVYYNRFKTHRSLYEKTNEVNFNRNDSLDGSNIDSPSVLPSPTE
jgi:soluble lytic murein transglycosylase-like protein